MLRTRDDVPEGLGRGTLTVRMCAERPCVRAMPGAVVHVPVKLRLAWADGPDWSTYQGNAAHDGHVPIAVDPRAISHAWTWDFPPGSSMAQPQQVATSGALGFVTVRQAEAQGTTLLAFGLHDAALRWQHHFDDSAHAPATGEGRVYVATTGGPTPRLWSFDASSGEGGPLGDFGVLRTSMLAPTIAHGVAYVNGGAGYRQGVYAFDATDGLPLWTAHNRTIDTTTPAVANGRVFHYDDDGLHVYDAFDGTLLQAIADPRSPFVGLAYRAAPMLGSGDHVLAYSGGYNYEPARHLVNYAPAKGTVRWVSADRYVTAPATSDRIVYAATTYANGITPSLHAIDEATGDVLARWSPGGKSTYVLENVVATRNLLFATTTGGTHALDRATLQPVWFTPARGHLSISGTGMLLILAGDRIHAYSLRGVASR